MDRTCRLRRFRGQRATGCDAGQSEHRLRGHSREARSEKVAFKAASRREHESIARCCRSFVSANIVTSSWIAVVIAISCDKLGFEVGLTAREGLVRVAPGPGSREPMADDLGVAPERNRQLSS